MKEYLFIHFSSWKLKILGSYTVKKLINSAKTVSKFRIFFNKFGIFRQILANFFTEIVEVLQKLPTFVKKGD